MPIKLPTIQRLAPIAPTRTPGIETQSVNVSQGFQQQSNAVSSAVSKTIAIYQRAQEDTYNSQVQDDELALADFVSVKMNGDPSLPESERRGLKHHKGNPDEPFRDFDVAFTKKYEELIANNGLSGTHKERAAARLNRRYNTLNNTVLTSYGHQRAAYKSGLANGTSKMLQQDMFSSLAHFKVGEPSTLAPFDQHIDGIRANRVNEADTNGQIRVVPSTYKGRKQRQIDPVTGATYWVVLDPVVEEKILTDISKGVHDSINGMIKGGRIPEARELIKRYGNYMKGPAKASIDAAFETKDIEQSSLLQLSTWAHLKISDRKTKIDGMPTNTHRQREIQREVRKIEDTRQSRMDRAEDRASTDVYNQAMTQLEPLLDPSRAGGKQITTTGQLENTVLIIDGAPTKVKDFLHRITNPAQRKAMFKGVQEAKEGAGDIKAYGVFMDKQRTGTLTGMSFPTMQQEIAGFNKRQTRNAEGAWKIANNKKGTTNSRAAVNRAYSEMMKMAFNSRLIRNVEGTPALTRDSELIAYDLQQKFNEELADQITDGMNFAEVDRLVRRMVLEMKDKVNRAKTNEGIFSKSSVKNADRFNVDKLGKVESTKNPTQELTKTQADKSATRYSDLSPQQQLAWGHALKKKLGHSPSTAEILKAQKEFNEGAK